MDITSVSVCSRFAHSYNTDMTMKLYVQFLATLAIVSLFGCKSSAPEQPNYRPVGRYTAAPTDEDVRATADAAIRAVFPDGKAELVSILQAERQVVAGLKYRITLVVKRDGEERTYATVVWRKVDGTFDVESWNDVRTTKKSDN